MKPVQIQCGKAHILYDAELPVQAEPVFFDVAHWQARGRLAGMARGRGEAAFLDVGDYHYVLRHYRRGGLPGRFVRDRFLWCGLCRSRAWREWQLTAELYGRGLPVPRPVAAQVVRDGLFYRADIVTLRINDSRSLAQVLAAGTLPYAQWRELGRCLRRFHDAGLDHADLNAHNILLSGDDFFVIDFDRGRLRAPGAWRQRNLARLLRSLHKLAQTPPFAFADADWQALLDGYGGQSAASARA